MEESIVMLVIVGILIIIIGISFALSKKKNKKNNKSNVSSSNSKSSQSRTSKDNVQRKDMSEFIKFDKIANDMIYQKKGEKYTMAIECKGINYDLMSSIEQMSVEEGFIKFLNTLKFPIQLYVQTRTVNLGDNIKKYKERTQAFEDTYSEMISKYNEAEEDIDVSKEDTERLRFEKIKYGNIAEYASDITRYVERMSLNKFMLQRKYYVLISYYKSEIAATEKFTKEEYEELCYRELYTRAQGIISSLTSCSVTGRILNSNELAELIYISYNRDDQKAIDIKRALESGFYRLYSTSDDVMEKKREMLDEQIKKEAARRVEEAIQEGLKNGTLLTPEEAQKRLDKRIDKEAINLVNQSDISKQTKEKVKDAILENRKKRLETQNNKENESKNDLEEGINNDDRLNQNIVESQNMKFENSIEDENINEENKEYIERKEREISFEKVINGGTESINPITNSEINNTFEEKKFPSMNDEIMMREQMQEKTEENSLRNQEQKEENNINNIENKQTKTIEDSDEDDSIV